mmetsp:Transcript_97607/g.252599  ORF Transcript_97607/g.252599 Transcript_97607/m.252599 type:complete len:232 (-) Transcript_97607:82-777(-)
MGIAAVHSNGPEAHRSICGGPILDDWRGAVGVRPGQVARGAACVQLGPRRKVQDAAVRVDPRISVSRHVVVGAQVMHVQPGLQHRGVHDAEEDASAYCQEAAHQRKPVPARALLEAFAATRRKRRHKHDVGSERRGEPGQRRHRLVPESEGHQQHHETEEGQVRSHVDQRGQVPGLPRGPARCSRCRVGGIIGQVDAAGGTPLAIRTSGIYATARMRSAVFAPPRDTAFIL